METTLRRDALIGNVALACHGSSPPANKNRRGEEIDHPRFWLSDWEVGGSKVVAHPQQTLGPILSVAIYSASEHAEANGMSKGAISPASARPRRPPAGAWSLLGDICQDSTSDPSAGLEVLADRRVTFRLRAPQAAPSLPTHRRHSPERAVFPRGGPRGRLGFALAPPPNTNPQKTSFLPTIGQNDLVNSKFQVRPTARLPVTPGLYPKAPEARGGSLLKTLTTPIRTFVRLSHSRPAAENW